MEIKLPTVRKVINDFGLNLGGEAQVFVTELARQYMNPFVPTQGVSGQGLRALVFPIENYTALEYRTPYAHYQYRGLLYVDPITLKGSFYNPNWGHWSRPGINKIPDPLERKLNYTAPLASDHWDKAMLEKQGKEFNKAIQKWLDRKYKK